MKKLLIGLLVVLMLTIATVSANPILNLIGNKLINEGGTLTFDITCSAPDSGSTSFLKNVSFGTLTKYNETKATFSWTPGYDDAGTYSVNFTVNDGNSLDSKVITITVANTNRAPVWTGNIPSQSVVEDSGLFVVGDVNTLANDPDGGVLTFSIGVEDTSKVDCIIDSDGTDLKIQPAADFSGTATCKVRARDSGGLYADSSFSITVSNTPDIPSITSAPVTSADINEVYTYDVQANDPDGDTLVYSLTIFPDGMTIVPSTGVISWTPNATGDYNVKVQVTDGNSVPVEQSFVVAVDYPTKLEIYSIDAWVDGDGDDSADETGGSIDSDVRPGSEIKLRVKLKNTYTSSEDIKIEDVEVNVFVEGMDEDEDDIEMDESIDDIRPGRTGSVDFVFDVPLEIEEGEYDMTVTVVANDEQRDYDMAVDFVVKVSKKNHDIRISQAVFSPESLVCSRHANFNVEIMNVGDNDEDIGDRIKLEVKGQELGIDFVKSSIELDSSPGSDTNTFEKTFSIDLDENFAPGVYTVSVKAYRGTDLMDLVQKEFLIEQCTLQTTQSSDSGTASGGSDVVVNTGVDLTSGLPPGFEGYTVGTAEETSFSGSGLYIAVLIIVIIAVLGGGVFLVVKFLKPKGGIGQGQFNY